MPVLNKKDQVTKLPFPNEEGGKLYLTAVLKYDYFDRYAVYVGKGTPQFVADHGTKQIYSQAKYFFPNIKREKYRR